MAGYDVIANPAEDAPFVEAVRRLSRGEADVRSLEASLRAIYPRARVQRSVVSGSEGERWYVYRDGNWAGDSTRRVGTTESVRDPTEPGRDPTERRECAGRR